MNCRKMNTDVNINPLRTVTTLTENRRPAVRQHSDLQSELVKQPKSTYLVLRLNGES